MRPLATGKSPVISARLPARLYAAAIKAAGPGRGAQSRWLRDLLERELTDAACTCNREAARP